MNAVVLSLGTFVSTTAGGLFALRFRDRLHLVLSFSAGVLLGVVCFEILPEIFLRAGEQGMDPTGPMITLLTGFLVFHGIEKFLLVHPVHEQEYAPHRHPHVGVFSALSLAGHSFMDGVAIGMAFQVSQAVGLVVAMAVITHDFCDGLNTVGVMLMHNNTISRATGMLLVDALAPVVGAASTTLVRVPPAILILYLGFFAGFLFYIAASEILPEAHSRSRSGDAAALIALTCLGALCTFVAVRMVG